MGAGNEEVAKRCGRTPATPPPPPPPPPPPHSRRPPPHWLRACDDPRLAGCDNIASISGASSVRLGGTQAVRCTPSTAGAVVSWSRHSSGRPVAHTGEVYVVDGALARHAGFYFCLVTAAGCTSRWDTHVNVLWRECASHVRSRHSLSSRAMAARVMDNEQLRNFKMIAYI